MPPANTISRASLSSAWRAAQQGAGVEGALLLSPAAFAGHLLECAGGDVGRALSLIAGESTFYTAVRARLHAVDRELVRDVG